MKGKAGGVFDKIVTRQARALKQLRCLYATPLKNCANENGQLRRQCRRVEMKWVCDYALLSENDLFIDLR